MCVYFHGGFCVLDRYSDNPFVFTFQYLRQNLKIFSKFFVDDESIIGEWMTYNALKLYLVLWCFRITSGLKVNWRVPFWRLRLIIEPLNIWKIF